MIAVRATISLPGLPVGREARVDPTNDYVRMCLDAKLIVPIDGVWPPPTPSDVVETEPVE